MWFKLQHFNWIRKKLCTGSEPPAAKRAAGDSAEESRLWGCLSEIP